MQPDLENCYRILELPPGASIDDVKQAYRVLAKVWHPDRFAGDPSMSSIAEEKLKQINYAYDQIRSAGTFNYRSTGTSNANSNQRTGMPPRPQTSSQEGSQSLKLSRGQAVFGIIIALALIYFVKGLIYGDQDASSHLQANVPAGPVSMQSPQPSVTRTQNNEQAMTQAPIPVQSTPSSVAPNRQQEIQNDARVTAMNQQPPPPRLSSSVRNDPNGPTRLAIRNINDIPTATAFTNTLTSNMTDQQKLAKLTDYLKARLVTITLGPHRQALNFNDSMIWDVDQEIKITFPGDKNADVIRLESVTEKSFTMTLNLIGQTVAIDPAVIPAFSSQ